MAISSLGDDGFLVVDGKNNDTRSLFEIFKPDYFLLKIQVNTLSGQIHLDWL